MEMIGQCGHCRAVFTGAGSSSTRTTLILAEHSLNRRQMNGSDSAAHFGEERTLNLLKAPGKAFALQCHSAQSARYPAGHLWLLGCVQLPLHTHRCILYTPEERLAARRPSKLFVGHYRCPLAPGPSSPSVQQEAQHSSLSGLGAGGRNEGGRWP